MFAALLAASSTGGDHFVAEQLIALAVTVAVLAAAALAAHFAGRGGGILMGKDGRLSTSKTIALMWTIVVVYCLLTLIFIALKDSPNIIGFIKDHTAALDGIYLVLLGGPFASLVLAKVATVTNIARGALQKPPADGTLNPGDLINDDTGNTDLVDFQYSAFNLVAVLYVLIPFIGHPAAVGLPDIPAQIAVLTGASAAAYVVNKGLTTNRPQVTSVAPQRQRAGGLVTIRGANLWMSSADDKTAVTVNGVATRVVENRAADTLRFIVPPFVLPTPPDRPYKIAVTTSAGAQVEATDGLVVEEDKPQIGAPVPQPVSLGGIVTIPGRYLTGPQLYGADGMPTGIPPQPEVRVDAKPCTLTGTATEDQLQFTFPADWRPPLSQHREAIVIVHRAGKDSNTQVINVSAAVPAPVG